MRWLARKFMDLVWWDWAHVGIFKLDAGYKHKIFIHCFESRWGSRRVKVIHSDKYPGSRWEDDLRRGILWQTRVYPWLKGIRDDGIPTYKQCTSKKEEFLSKLKGENLPRILNDDENQ